MAITSELPIDTGASAMDMANAMFGAGISVLDASYQGAVQASGIYSQGDSVAPGVTPSDSGVILSTGRAADITNSSGDANISAGTSTSNFTSGDADLSAISGQSTFDAEAELRRLFPELYEGVGTARYGPAARRTLRRYEAGLLVASAPRCGWPARGAAEHPWN